MQTQSLMNLFIDLLRHKSSFIQFIHEPYNQLETLSLMITFPLPEFSSYSSSSTVNLSSKPQESAYTRCVPRKQQSSHTVSMMAGRQETIIHQQMYTTSSFPQEGVKNLSPQSALLAPKRPQTTGWNQQKQTLGKMYH